MPLSLSPPSPTIHCSPSLSPPLFLKIIISTTGLYIYISSSFLGGGGGGGGGDSKNKSKQGCNFTSRLTSCKHPLKLCLILNQAFTLYTNSGQTIPKLSLNTSQLKNSVKLLMSTPQTRYRSEWAKHASS